MKNFKKILLTFFVLSFCALLNPASAYQDIHTITSGDWYDANIWDLHRVPNSTDNVHIENSAIVSLNSLTVCNELHLDNGSLLNVNAPLRCNGMVHLDNSSNICLNADFVACYLVLDNTSNFYGNGKNVTITNCANVSNPISILNGSRFRFNKDCTGKNVIAGTLNITGNTNINDCDIIYNNITITNGTLDLGSCNITINGTLTLNSGGDFTTTGTLAYGQNAILAFNRNYTLTNTSKIWGSGTTSSNVPLTVNVLSGVITTNDTLCVKNRMNLLGGVVGSGSVTKIKLQNDTVYFCGGTFASSPFTGINVTRLSCATNVTTTSQTNIPCYGATTGSATFSAIGGTSPYTWSKDGINYQISSTFNNLAAGTYTIRNKDLNDFITNKTLTITQPNAPLQISISTPTSTNCISGTSVTATANVTGGTGAYSYSWNTTPVQLTATATGLSAGTYTVTVTDANNCTEVKSITLSTNPSTFAYTTNPSATTQPLSSNSFSFVAYGAVSGETFSWDFGDGSFSTSSTITKSYANYGIYNAKLITTNAAGCTNITYQTVLVTTPKVMSTVPVCNSGSGALTMIQKIVFPVNTTDWSGSNLKIKSAIKFDTCIGTLTGVKLISNGSFTTSNKVEILGSMAAGTKALVSIQTTGTMSCAGPGFVYGITPQTILDTFYSTGYDGTKDYAGTSGRTFGFHTSSKSDSTIITTPSILAAYTGLDSVSFTAYTNTQSSSTFPTGNSSAILNTTATDTLTLVYYYCPNASLVCACAICIRTINSVKNGNWNNPTTWDLGRIPNACDNVHIRNSDSVTVTPGFHAVCRDILCDGNSKLYIYDTLNCREFSADNSGHVTKVFGKLNVCSMTLNHSSNVYACSNITFSNCTNKIHPLEILNSAHLNPLGGNYCSSVNIILKIDSGNVDLSGLCAGNVGIQTLSITNATVTLAACNNIVDYIILNHGGNVIGSTPTWTGVSKLAINRDYTLDAYSVLWQAGTSNVPHSIDILSGNVNINTTKTVVTRMQLLGGVVYGGTNLSFANNSYLFRCGGILSSPALMGTNVTVEMCSDTNTNNPPATIGSTDMPVTGFTGDLIISTNVVLGGNILVPNGKVIVKSTGILNDSNFNITSATSVQVDSGGVVYTSKLGGLGGANSLIGSLPITLDHKSTVVFNAHSGNQVISPVTSYGNIICADSSSKFFSTNTTTVIYGNLTNTGTGLISGTTGSTVNYVGTNQFVAGVAYYNVNFYGYGTTTMTGTSSVAANMNMNVTSGVVVQTNNNLTLLSGPTGTAQIGQLLNGADVLGNVCWLRYIPGGSSNRRWRFLSCPIQNVTFRWWQNDMFITGPGTGGVPCAWNTTSQSSMVQNSNGFDQNASGVYSCFVWSESSATWQSISSTNNIINPLTAYRTFVRGDRNIEGCILMTNMPDSVSAVTLHSCGPIVKFTQTASLSYTAGIGNGWSYVSNPYPCSIDWWNVNWRSVRSSSINNTIYIWNPNMNQYASWSPFAGGTLGASNLIGTGQSFFIKTNAAVNLVFQEEYKLDSGQIGLFGKTSTSNFNNNLKVSMSSSTSNDEGIIFIHGNATLNYEDAFDAMKMGFSVGSIASSTKVNSSKLVFNGIGNVSTIDTIILNTYLATTTTSYTLKFNGVSNFDPQYIVLLRDKYLSVITNLSTSSTYTFTTSTGIAASFDQTRFEIVIMNSSSLPVTLVNFTANKQADKTVLVKWTTASEINNSHFIVEHSTDAVNFTQIEVVKGAGNTISSTNYSYTHVNPVNGLNYYRLTQVDRNNSKTVTYIIAVNLSDEIPGVISLFPVPANNELNVNFGNAQFSGNISVKIFDMIGRQVLNRQLSVSSKNQVSSLDISKLTSGSYFISVTSENGNEQKIKFIKD
ncbi:MAG: choice-of-anchor E domain-containing protein [Bacteroidota bacterium]